MNLNILQIFAPHLFLWSCFFTRIFIYARLCAVNYSCMQSLVFRWVLWCFWFITFTTQHIFNRLFLLKKEKKTHFPKNPIHSTWIVILEYFHKIIKTCCTSVILCSAVQYSVLCAFQYYWIVNVSKQLEMKIKLSQHFSVGPLQIWGKNHKHTEK